MEWKTYWRRMQDISMRFPTQSLSHPVYRCQQNKPSHMISSYIPVQAAHCRVYLCARGRLCCAVCVCVKGSVHVNNGLYPQVLYVPDPEYVSSAGSSPSLSPISPLSPTSSEADLEKVTVCWPHLMHYSTVKKEPSLSTFTSRPNRKKCRFCIILLSL